MIVESMPQVTTRLLRRRGQEQEQRVVHIHFGRILIVKFPHILLRPNVPHAHSLSAGHFERGETDVQSLGGTAEVGQPHSDAAIGQVAHPCSGRGGGARTDRPSGVVHGVADHARGCAALELPPAARAHPHGLVAEAPEGLVEGAVVARELPLHGADLEGQVAAAGTHGHLGGRLGLGPGLGLWLD